jgi:hypothetical protein
MDPVWKNLPYDLVRHIFSFADLSIDSKLEFKIPPKRLDEAKCWKLWYLLKSHDGVVYNLESKSLHNFRIPGHHIIRRPVELNYHTAGLVIFNDTEDEHMVEITHPCGCFTSSISSEHWMSELSIIFRGSKPSRKLGIEDSMLIGC